MAKIKFTFEAEVTRRPDNTGWDWAVVPESLQATVPRGSGLVTPAEKRRFGYFQMTPFGLHLRKQGRMLFNVIDRALSGKRSKPGRPTRYADLPAFLALLKQQGITSEEAYYIARSYKISEESAQRLLRRYRSRTRQEAKDSDD